MIEAGKKECPTLLLLAMMVFSQNTYAFSPFATGYWALARNIAQLLIVCLLGINILRRAQINLKVLCVYLVFMSCMLLTMFLQSDFSGSYWILDCTIAFLFVEQYAEYSIAEKYEKIMFIVCGVYTLLYVFASCYLELFNTSICSFLENIHLVWYHSFKYQYYVNGVVPLRSYAFFREPGVYQMFIILAMVIEMFVREKMRWWHMGLYVIALLATQSTTGYLCLLVVVFLFVIKYVKKNRLTVLCGMGGLAGAMVMLPQILSSIIAKFTATGGNSHSWLSRQASVLTNLYFWKESPIIGVGISHILQNFTDVTRDVFGLQAGIYSIDADTNTILLFFAAFGTVAGCLFVIGTYGWCEKVAQSKLLTWGLFIILIFLYSGEAVNSTCYPYILFFIGISYLVNRKVNSR